MLHSPRALSLAALTWIVPACNAVEPEARIDSFQEGPDLAVESALELFPVTRVVDGDTIWIQRGGEEQKLRLLSVDTEERLSGRSNISTSKPETVFGEECALWAQEFFASLAADGAEPRIGLRFPDGVERLDVYGRLLCHVILPDGRDFNLLLVELGKSPYFNKYGNSLINHQAFVAAQDAARRAQRGIWNPATGRPATPGAPAARRPYGRLLPWWQARADAMDAFRRRLYEEPDRVAAADDPEALARAAAGDEPVDAFGEIYKIFEEDDGSQTVLFRSGDKDRALRVHITAPDVAAHAALRIAESQEEFRQNFLYVAGRVQMGPRGFELVSAAPSAWRRAGAEPVSPAPAPLPPGDPPPAR